MLSQIPYYHGTIRKAIITFGHLFSSLYFDRKTGDSVDGDFAKRIQVPIAYVNKEKWLARLEQDDSLEQYILTSLPRIGFEIAGFTYDPQRKLNKMNKVVCNDGDTSKTVYAPVPYNLAMKMYIVTGTQEDAMQIVEQILPVFTPTYTMTIMALNAMEITTEVPITLTHVQPSDSAEGSFLDPRLVTWEFDFDLKLDIYGPISEPKIIYNVLANISASPDMDPTVAAFSAVGDPDDFTIISEDWLEGF